MIQYRNESVTVFQSALFQTNSTVVGTKELILIVDPTWLPEEVETIQKHVNHLDNGQPKYLFFTHSDFDHILGYDAFPDAITIASKGVAEYSKKEEIIQEIKEFDGQYYIQRPYELKYPYIDVVIEQDGQTLEVGETSLTFYLAPGHTADGAFVFMPHLHLLIAGDYVSNVEFPFIYDDSKAYEQTINKLEGVIVESDIYILVPGHGQVTTSRREMEKRVNDSRWYIQELRRQVKDSVDNEARLQSFINHFTFSSYLKPTHEDNKKQILTEIE